MSAIFNNPYTNTDTWSVQGASVKWSTGSGSASDLPLVMLAVQIGYQRSLTPLYPINKQSDGATKYVIAGPPRGSLSVNSILGPSQTALKSFIDAVTKDCKGNGDQVSVVLSPFGSSCTNPGWGSEITLTGLDMESIGLSIQSGESAVVNMPLSFTFTSMEFSGN